MERCYPHLSLEERRKIDKWQEAKMPVPEIADRLGRTPSTIYRKLKRNIYEDKELPELNGYYYITAQAIYEKRCDIHRKLIFHPELKEVIKDRLKTDWSLKQLAGRMRLERHPIRVSHETIYRFAYSKDGRDEQFYRHLPEHRRLRRPRCYRRHNRTHILDNQSLSHRPEHISQRAEFGHWECDLMMFRKEHGKVPGIFISRSSLSAAGIG
jgi:IS30 family transposase